MKYPQLVSMPSAISDWLEEQLEARGIDAIVYTRYVLSLLHRDPQDLSTSDSDLFGIEQSKGVGRSGSGPRGRKRARVRNGHALPPDQLRRSAAVQCLMSASEQNCGIESLVDELCIKLRQIENNTNDELETNRKIESKKNIEDQISPHDLARRYYTAFPALNGKSTFTNENLISNQGSISWNNLAKKLTTGNHNYNKNYIENIDKNQDSFWNTMPAKCTENKRFSYFNRNKKELGFNCSTRIMAKSVERSEGNKSLWDEQVHWHNQQNKSTFNNADEGYSTSDTNALFDEELHPPALRYESSERNVDDVDKLVAKFDRSIEALWSPDTNNENERLPLQEDDFQDVPVDFHELLASPSDQKSTNLIKMFKKNSHAIQKPQTFLQCGTNIISSIWSQQENTIDLNDAIDQHTREKRINYDNVKNEKLLANSFWNDENINIIAQNKANTFMENLALLNANNAIYIGNDSVDYSDKNVNFGWEFNYVDQQKWSEAENISSDLLKATPVFYRQEHETDVGELKVSFSKLNHNKEVSVFTEVKPKDNSRRIIDSNSALLRSIVRKNHIDVADSHEDDLLTSRRTHFCPIRLEETNRMYPSSNHLPDGSTFEIHGSPDKVIFRRTDSGTLFLESENESPKEYMEYKEKCFSVSSVDSDSSENELRFITTNEASNFVLKFRVRQNEKCCQTDDQDTSVLESPLEVVPAKRRVLCDTNELYFPGDDELANTMNMSNDDCTCLENKKPCFVKCKVHTTSDCEQCGDASWPSNLSGQFTVSAGIWDEQIWSSREQLCTNCTYTTSGGNVAPAPLTSLRDELQEEGEQLLSDISSFQKLYWCDDLGTNNSDERSFPREERKRRYSASLRPLTMAWHPKPTHLKSLRSLTF